MHTGLANGAALRLGGVTGSREFEDGSIIVCDENGAPTGELREMAAVHTVWSTAPEPTEEQRLAWVADTIRTQNALGLTGIHQMDGGIETIQALRAFEATGLLNLRVRIHQWVDPSHDAEALAEIIRRRDLSGSMWTANSVKFMLDGASTPVRRGSRSPTRTATATTRCGQIPTTSIARSASSMMRASTSPPRHRRQRDPRGSRRLPRSRRSAGRHRVEHIEAAPPELVSRFRRENVNASMQPIHLRWLNPQMNDSWSSRLGAHRCAHAMPSGDIQGTGANVVLGSDWPVAPFDPRLGFFAAQRRYAPDAPDHRAIGASRALTGLDTLTGYTSNAARVDGGAGGILAVGAPADFVAWGDDITQVAPEDVTDLPVHLTVVAGRVAYQRD